MSRLKSFVSAHQFLSQTLILIATFSFSFMVFISLFQSVKTFFGFPTFEIKPVEMAIQKNYGMTGHHLLVSFYVRLNEKALVHVSRELERTGHPDVYWLPSTDAWMEAQERHVRASAYIGANLAPGEWCMYYNARYRPSWALVDRSERHKVMCTEIKETEEEERAYLIEQDRKRREATQ